MFDFISMIGTYDSRKVDNTVVNSEIVVDTCAVTDSAQPYETGIESKLYNDGSWVIVELYDTIEEAQAGHDRWVEKMANPPKELIDVSTSSIKSLYNALAEEA
jgi:hypothetical protein